MHGYKDGGKSMKYSMFSLAVGLSALCAATLLSAYPNEVYIKNDSSAKVVFYGYFVADKDLPPMARRSHRVLEPQGSDTFGALILFEKPHQFEWEKITANQDKKFPKGFTGGQLPLLDSFDLDQNVAEPTYLIYSDSGFRVVTQQEWGAQNHTVRK